MAIFGKLCLNLNILLGDILWESLDYCLSFRVYGGVDNCLIRKLVGVYRRFIMLAGKFF